MDEAETVIISFPVAGNIYMLWSRLKKDDFQTEVIEVVREMSTEAKNILGDLRAEDFSEVYLFFDYDAHNHNIPKEYLNTDIIQEMLQCFDNETEFGKLYISYPMIESLREIQMKTESYASVSVSMQDGKKYKNRVSIYRDYQDFSKITTQKWMVACKASARRANLIVQKQNTIPTYRCFIYQLTQNMIYQSQIEQFVLPKQEICVLNSIPLFLLEYFEETFWNEMYNSNEGKRC